MTLRGSSLKNEISTLLFQHITHLLTLMMINESIPLNKLFGKHWQLCIVEKKKSLSVNGAAEGQTNTEP